MIVYIEGCFTKTHVLENPYAEPFNITKLVLLEEFKMILNLDKLWRFSQHPTFILQIFTQPVRVKIYNVKVFTHFTPRSEGTHALNVLVMEILQRRIQF